MLNVFITSLLSALIFTSLSSSALELGLGGNYSDYDYQELPKPTDSEEGWVASWIADLKADLTSSTQLEFRYSRGTVNATYTGFTLNSNTPATAVDPLTMTDYEGLVKQQVVDSFYLFAGTGYHVWDRKVGGAPGYPHEVYSWMYLPFGFEYAFALEPNQEIRFHFEAQQMFSSSLKATFLNYSDVNVNLGSKTNLLVKLPIRWNPGAAFSVETTPWFEYSSIGQSNTVAVPTGISSSGYLLEPNSTAYQYGLEILFIVKI